MLTAYSGVLPTTSTTGSYGMTLRDYFAAKAMQIILAKDFKEDEPVGRVMVSEYAYEVADAMMKAREA